MLGFQIGLLAIAGLISILFGVRYFFASQFMPYHATVVGKSWTELEPGVRTIILGMLKIIGGGFLAYGLAVLWLLIPLGQKQSWAAWAVLTVSIASVLPSVYVTIWLRRVSPSARTPVVPAVAVLVMALAGSALSFVP